MKFDYQTIPQALALKFNAYNFKASKPNIRRHALLPAMKFSKGGKDIDITTENLNSIVALLKGGTLGEKLMVTLAHPHGEQLTAAPAVGWIMCKSAEVSAYKDTQALYADIKWLPEMAADIESEKYQYISPVFTDDYVDQSGNERGWALLLAGVTNTPHWTDQPGLWQAFTKALDSAQLKEVEMDSNVQDKAKELSATLAAKDKEIEALKASMAKYQENEKANQAKVTEFSTQYAEQMSKVKELTANLEAVMKERRQERGDNLIAKYQASGHLLHKHLNTTDGKHTSLWQMAYEQPEKFEEIVNLMAPVVTNDTNNGATNGRIEMSDEDLVKAAKDLMAKDKMPVNDDSFFAALARVKAGK